MKDWLMRKDVLWGAGMAALLVAYLAFGDTADPCRDEPVPLAAASGQGDGAIPEGEPVTVEGVVTGAFPGRDALNGFFMQAPDGQPPGALFVYAPGLTEAERERVRPGHLLQVTGVTARFHGRPQIGDVETVYHCGAPGRPEPDTLELPLADADRDRLEGRLVRYPGTLTVIDNYHLGRYGTLELAPERLIRGRSDDQPGERLLLDDGSYRADPDPVPYLDDTSGTRRAGDRVHAPVGVLTFAFDRWRLHPVEPPRFQAANPRPEAPASVSGDVRAAAFNVENYFLTLGERGAADADALERQRARLLAALQGLDADLLALVELENDAAAAEDLAERASAALDGPEYRAVTGGDTGSDAIKVGFAYRPDRLTLLEGPFRDTASVHNRPPQAAVFRPVDGEPLLAVVVHFKAKVGCPDTGDVDRGQGCWNRLRTRQADALLDFVGRKVARTGVDDVLLLGDFNSYAAEDPVRRLEAADYLNLVADRLPPESQYSYVFRGGAGTLDYGFASESMAARVAGATIWHINADEPPVFGVDGRLSDAPATDGPYRASDHDPLLLGIDALH
ncbi:ExeM/NucH family extracellular endonuclease [Aquisalimonas asiatica]|uniref:Endonuclease/exonuclease/phosphatase domain-containing protein n=1 Tax=Aquisalimonas asiatica TaxID=406100 RepID=A0A1H8TGA6_9GAMM|nr:ExeM/NucH family extracellular endonuclease [Aquisalimonas asiatica]SEO90159.1 hypothetical protein SAMN04488052_104173 [Aquisalimonas asiatica]